MYFLKNLFLLIFSVFAVAALWAQPKLEFNMKKPKQFENRQLPSERLAEKRFTFPRRFFQNNYTHFNYYFNANEKLNEIIAASKEQTKDDYTKLLSFYPYSLDETSKSSFLDSILQKCTAGILLHDLRNDWIDNMYLVMGKAYLLRKNYDSAAATFQFINFTFNKKEKGGYDKVIGSNAENGSNAFTIATKEKTGKFSYLVTRPPSRNEAFVWQVRTLTENGEYLDASSLIETLKNDPYFPERLKEELAEARAYLYYKMNMWDSAATYLVKAIPEAGNQQDKARDWYLAGQMFQLANNYRQASEAYAKCTALTVDPVMEVYARLNTIRLNKSDDPKVIDANIASLNSMAKKDKYQNYRDIIYYAIALFELERNGYNEATGYLKKSIFFNNDNLPQRSRSFMQMGDIAYNNKQYAFAGLCYDSVSAAVLDDAEAARLEKRGPGTHDIYLASLVITLQDSLLNLAGKSEAERTAIVKQVSKKLRKDRGLKEDPTLGQNDAASPMQNPAAAANTPAPSLFNTTGSSWYFYDQNIRANGFLKFRQRWGGRPNVDNWRRSASISISQTQKQGNPDEDTLSSKKGSEADLENFDTTDISFDNLYSRIPLSDDRKQKSRARLSQAYFDEGTSLHDKIEDFPEAIKAFEKSLSFRDSGANAEKALFALVHSYTQTGDAENARRCTKLLHEKFGNSASAIKLTATGQQTATKNDKAANSTYQHIYDLFIEGRFEEAMSAKALADSALGNSYWTPQLLYIESVYHIRQKQDSLAIKSLNDLSANFADHPLSAKAKVMIDVLGRRREIEEYLTKLEITRAREEETVVSVARPPIRKMQQASDSLKTTAIKPANIAPLKDTSAKLTTGVVTQVSPYLINPAEPCKVALLLSNVDPAYVNEVLYSFNNSSRKNFNGQPVVANKKKLKDNLWLLLLSSDEFKNAESAVVYINYIKPIAQKELISWLDVSKYSYIIINDTNLSLLEQDPNMPLYLKVLQETFPGKF